MAQDVPVAKSPLDAAPLGLRIIAFGVRNLGTIVASTFVFLVLGLAVGFLWPRPFVDKAIVEIGVRFEDEPIEHPIVVSARLVGALGRAANELGHPGAEIDIDIRRTQKSNAVTRLMEVRVSADGADDARAILDRGVSQLVEEHGAVHGAELAIVTKQLGRLERAAERLSHRDVPTEDEGDLDATLSETNRLITTTRNHATEVRLPKTRVVSHAVEPQRTPPRWPVFGLGGLVFGLGFGVAIAAVRGARGTV